MSTQFTNAYEFEKLNFDTKNIIQASVQAEDAPEPYTVIARISTPNINRNGYKIHQFGGDYTNYIKNPVLLKFHQSNEKPIGDVYDITITNPQTVSKARFNSTVDGQDFALMYKTGQMKAFSIGIKPIEYEFNDKEQYIDIIRWEMLELSCVSLGADPDALTIRNCLNMVKGNYLKNEFSKQLFDIYDAEQKELNEKLENALKTIADNKNQLEILKNTFDKYNFNQKPENKNEEILNAINKFLKI